MKEKHKTLKCFVKTVKDGTEVDLGAFPMLDSKEIAFAELVPAFFFDYYALCEELVNRQIIEDDIEASLVCEQIECKLNDEGLWNGDYKSREGDVVVTYKIEPDAVRTEDGFLFTRQEDGSYSDGDMEWPNFEEFKATCEVEWVPVALP